MMVELGRWAVWCLVSIGTFRSVAPPLLMLPSYDAGRFNEVKSLSSAVTLRLESPQIPQVPFFGLLLMHVVVRVPMSCGNSSV